MKPITVTTLLVLLSCSFCFKIWDSPPAQSVLEKSTYGSSSQLINGQEKTKKLPITHSGEDTETFKTKQEFDQFLQKMQKHQMPTNKIFSERVKQLKATDHSQTNNLINGVQQTDNSVTDGTYIYTMSMFKVFSIVSAYPPTQLKVLSSLKVPDNYIPQADGFFLEGNYVCFIRYKETREYYPEIMISALTYDISNKQSPVLVRNVSVSGSNFISTKLNNGYVYLSILVRNDSQEYRYYNMKIIAFSLLDPYQKQNTIRLNQQYIQFYFDYIHYRNYCFQICQKNIYIIRMRVTDERTFLKRISINKTTLIISGEIQMPYMSIPSYEDFNFINEAGSFLRVISFDVIDKQPELNIYVLDMSLQIYGVFRNLSNWYQIIEPQVKYIGDRLFFISNNHYQANELCVISFENNRSPKKVASLKNIDYFHNIHEYDTNTIIAVGQKMNGIKMASTYIALFTLKGSTLSAVSRLEMAAETPNARALIGYKEFLFMKSRNTAVISYFSDSYEREFSFAYVLNVDKDKKQISIVKKINHLLNPPYPPPRYLGPGYPYVQNSMSIGQFLYTKSHCLLRVSNMDQEYSEVGNLILPCDPKQKEQNSSISTETN